MSLPTSPVEILLKHAEELRETADECEERLKGLMVEAEVSKGWIAHYRRLAAECDVAAQRLSPND